MHSTGGAGRGVEMLPPYTSSQPAAHPRSAAESSAEGVRDTIPTGAHTHTYVHTHTQSELSLAYTIAVE